MNTNETKNVVAVILARGGSKGIPGKNMKKVGSVTLIGRAINAAKSAKTVDCVLVSTDDMAIRHEALSHGASVIDRPPALAGDTIESEPALLHAVQTWQEKTGLAYRAIALIQATSPFTTPVDIERVMEPIMEGDADSTVSVVDDYGYLWSDGENGWTMPYQVRARRQDRGPWKREAGNVYGIRYPLLVRTGKLFQGRIQAVTIPLDSWHEIDDHRELAIADLLAKSREDGSKAAA